MINRGSTYSKELKEEIRSLRSKGLTYFEIRLKLKREIPRSSLNYICRDIALDNEQKLRIQKVTGNLLAVNRQKAIATNQKIFNAKLEQYRNKNKNLYDFMQSYEAKLVALTMLYLGEGAKWNSHRGLSFSSSSTMIIKLYVKLLNDCFSIRLSQLHARIQHRADQDSKQLINHWSKETGIKKENFYPCYVDKRTIDKPTKKLNYYGVCSISCAGTHIQLELAEIADIINESVRGIGAVG